MATKEFKRLTSTVLALPARQRVRLAQALWNSIDGQIEDFPLVSDIMAEIKRRDREITLGKVRCKNHAEVMKAAYKAIGCSR